MVDINIQMNAALALDYNSNAQKARVITETWVLENMYCPRCGSQHLEHFKNNKPVADFYCPQCGSQYELKSKNGSALERINDGAYSTMIDRITGLDNPDFFFMSYRQATWSIHNFFFVPKHFFTPEIIEKRAPLSSNARRAGWVGCNILLGKIPVIGKIPIIENEVIFSKETIMEKVSMAELLKVSTIDARGWLFDTLSCIEKLPGRSFSLSEMYSFEEALFEKHPGNNNIRAKIRQQLQILRDKGIIEFVRPGEYKKIL